MFIHKLFVDIYFKYKEPNYRLYASLFTTYNTQ